MVIIFRTVSWHLPGQIATVRVLSRSYSTYPYQLPCSLSGTTAAFALHSEHVRRKAKLLGWGIVVMFFTNDLKVR